MVGMIHHSPVQFYLGQCKTSLLLNKYIILGNQPPISLQTMSDCNSDSIIFQERQFLAQMTF